MEKLLHERLREWAQKDKDGIPVLNEWTHYFGGSLDCPPKDADIWKSLADEIERYYIPRPRFEDGEPVQFGDLFAGNNGEECGLTSIFVDLDGFYKLNSCPEYYELHLKDCNHFVKLPIPKVYDADGAEINVGDYGYGLIEVFDDRDDMLKVERINANAIEVSRVNGGANPVWIDSSEFTHERPVFDTEGVRICKGDTVWTINVPKGHDKRTVKGFKTFDEIGTTDCDKPSTHAVLFEEGGWMGNLRVTHREPDSLEKLLDDISQFYSTDPEAMRVTSTWYQRIEALIERGAQ